MEGFTIITDSGANLDAGWREKYSVTVLPLAYIVNGESFSGANVTDADTVGIYAKIKNKVSVSTASLNEDDIRTACEKTLSDGKDILYIGFSSALSISYETAARVLDELKVKYPKRKVLHIDTKAAAMGQGRLVIEAAKLREAGKTIEETHQWLQENILKCCHLFTVESLTYLFRGGRLKHSAYLLGTMLQIKPIMYVNNGGRLVPIGKAFGRKKSLNEIAARTAKMIVNPAEQTVYINHGDCLDDARYLADRIAEKVKVAGFDFSLLNTIIGAHAGPGTIAVFFAGEKR
jgi:DegV family protein with EDD domain